MWTLVAGILALSAVDVTVKPLVGPEVVGQLTELTSDKVVIETAEGAKSFDRAELLTVSRRSESATDDVPAVWIDLTDGSRLLATSYSVKSRRVAMTLVGGRKLETTTRAIRSVRFKKPSAAVDEAWQTLAASDVEGDVIVFRASATSLDQLDGVLHDVSADEVQFALDDDDPVPVDRARVEGVIYFHATRSSSKPVCSVADAFGSTWQVKSLELGESGVAISGASGVKLTLPLEEISAFDFSAGNLVYLSDLEPTSVEWTPFLESPAAAERLAKWNRLRRDESFDGGKLRLGKTEYNKGLAIHSRSEIVYRLTDDFEQLKMVAGIDDRQRPGGNVELVIWADNKQIFKRTITGEMAPMPLEFSIAGVKRLKILVDFGEVLDIRDHLDLCDARITK